MQLLAKVLLRKDGTLADHTETVVCSTYPPDQADQVHAYMEAHGLHWVDQVVLVGAMERGNKIEDDWWATSPVAGEGIREEDIIEEEEIEDDAADEEDLPDGVWSPLAPLTDFDPTGEQRTYMYLRDLELEVAQEPEEGAVRYTGAVWSTQADTSGPIAEFPDLPASNLDEAKTACVAETIAWLEAHANALRPLQYEGSRQREN